MDGIAHKLQARLNAPVTANQVAFFPHFRIVFRFPVHRGPDRHHQLNAQRFQFLHHGIGVRPIGGVKFPFALFGPVKEIHHNHIDGQTPALVFPCNGEQLLLGLIAQLALPEAQAVLRHHWNRAGDRPIGFQNLRRCIASHNPIVQRLGGIGLQTHDVFAEHRPAHAGIVPQQTVAQRRHHKGYRRLGIAVGQLQVRAFEIEIGLLILSHTVELFLRVQRFQPHGQMVVASQNGPEFPCLHLDGAAFGVQNVPPVAAVLLQQQFAVLVVSCQLAVSGQMDRQFSVGDGPAVPLFLSCGSGLHRLGQGPALFREMGLFDGLHPKGIVPPGSNGQRFLIIRIGQYRFVPSNHMFTPLLLHWSYHRYYTSA